MRFTENEIEKAIRLRGAGLEWDPQPGHYAFDIDGVMKAGSPFQAGVYMITSLSAFIVAAGGNDSGTLERFAWLPTWEDARDWLRDRGVEREAVLEAMRLDDEATDRERLYGLMLQHLDRAGVR